jgi:hypothetical protein
MVGKIHDKHQTVENNKLSKGKLDPSPYQHVRTCGGMAWWWVGSGNLKF